MSSRETIECVEELRTGASEMANSEDPIIKEYFGEIGNFYDLPMWRKLEALRPARATQAQTHYKALTRGKRLAYLTPYSHLWRDPDVHSGDNPRIVIRCPRCRSTDSKYINPDPLFEKKAGRYIRRRIVCQVCSGKQGRAARFMEP